MLTEAAKRCQQNSEKRVSIFCYSPNAPATHDFNRKAKDKGKQRKHLPGKAEYTFNTRLLTLNKSHLLPALLHIYLTHTLEVVAVANATVKKHPTSTYTASREAPCKSSSSAMFTCPFLAASWSGDSFWYPVVFTNALCRSNSSTTSVCPWLQASC